MALGGIAILLSSTSIEAQTPQYTYTAGTVSNAIPTASASSNKRQMLYLASYFNGTPSGTISSIFFQTPSSGTYNYTSFTIKMGYTSLSALSAGSFITGLTTVFNGTAAFTTTSVNSNWAEITLQTPFYFDSTQNLIVEISQSGYTAATNIYYGSVTNSSLYGSATGTTGSVQSRLANFGFTLSTPLPITITAFSAAQSHGDVMLSWNTVLEENIASFSIERSTDGKSFSEIKVLNFKSVEGA